MGQENWDLIAAGKVEALKAVALLDQRNAWVDLPSKEVPGVILSYVMEALKEESLDEVRRSLGMGHPSDARWRKIITAIRVGQRIDSTAIFLQWLHRNKRLASMLDDELKKVLEGQKPFTKMTFEAVNAINNLQANTVKMGKDLGVFTDPHEGGKGGGGVTIVVQTLVPSPSKEQIIEAQRVSREKSQELLDLHKPKDSDADKPQV